MDAVMLAKSLGKETANELSKQLNSAKRSKDTDMTMELANDKKVKEDAAALLPKAIMWDSSSLNVLKRRLKRRQVTKENFKPMVCMDEGWIILRLFDSTLLVYMVQIVNRIVKEIYASSKFLDRTTLYFNLTAHLKDGTRWQAWYNADYRCSS